MFFLFNVLPGDPARMLLGQRADLQTVEMIRSELGLDKSKGLQYVRYINDLSPLSVYNKTDPDNYFFLDSNKYSKTLSLVSIGKSTIVLKPPYLGRSYQQKRNVTGMITDVIPPTFLLALTAIFFAFIIGITLGIICALKKDTWIDRVLILLSTIGVSLPSFFTAILFGWFFAFVLGDLTGLNLTGNIYEIDDFGGGRVLVLKNLLLPAITLGIRPLSVFIQLSRNSMLDVLSQDYIRTARAKGLSFSRIILKHALRNSLNPVVTAASGWFASLMAGVVFVEYIFGWKGLGYMIVDALNQYDMPVVLGAVITIASFFVLINILVDLLYSLLDPRIRSL